MRVPVRLSIPRRIFLGFALVVSVSGLVSVVSFVQHERTAAALALLHEGYLPLALTVSEARATQSVWSNLLDRVLSERDTAATRLWLNAARKTRPATLKEARDELTKIHTMLPWDTEGAALIHLQRSLRRLSQMTRSGDKRYDELYLALEKGDRPTAERTLADVRARERTIESEWRRMWSEIIARTYATSQRVSAQQAQALTVLWALAIAALLVGILVAWWSQRVLSPLSRLQERVEAVARGELTERLSPTNTDDEIGRLAQEFERMVKALVAREESLREAQSRLLQTERLAAIGRMAAHVSHEVRNPLSSIGLNVELLEEELADAGRETKDLLAAVHREIDRLRAVTDEYLRVARLPNPRLQAEFIGDVLQSTLLLLRAELNVANVTLDVHIQDDLPLVAMDEAQMRQVLINLIKNAREAMTDGGRIGVSATRTVQAGQVGVEVEVKDDGIGMDPQQKARIFDLFYTTKQRGSGLGLPLTQQIVVAHGGQIHCESTPGQGTVFSLFFPASLTDTATDTPHDPDAAFAARSPSQLEH